MKSWKIAAGIIGVALVLALTAFFFFLGPGARTGKTARIQKQADQAISSKNYIGAEVLLRKGLQSEPDNPDLLLKLGNVLEKEGVLEQAKQSYLSAAQAKKSAEPEYLAGMVALKLSQSEEAEKLFIENNQNFPDHIPTLYQLGALMAKQAKYEQAIAYFQKITKLGPAEAEAYNNLGFCYYSLGQLEKARDMFKKALELKPGFTSAQKSLETVEADLAGKPQQGSTVDKKPVCKTCK